MLALKQNQPEAALVMLSRSNQPNYITVRNLKILALTRLGNFSDAIAILRTDIYANEHMTRQRTILKDVVSFTCFLNSFVQLFISRMLRNLLILSTQMSEVGNLIEASAQNDFKLEFKRVSKLLRDGETMSNQVSTLFFPKSNGIFSGIFNKDFYKSSRIIL